MTRRDLKQTKQKSPLREIPPIHPFNRLHCLSTKVVHDQRSKMQMRRAAFRRRWRNIMPFIKVKLIDGSFTHPQKKQIVTRLIEAMESIDEKNPRSATWVVIEEVKLSDLDICAKTLWPVDVEVQATARTALVF
jgi:phenylpyruvate tautomerase PptA (4-oxalocrotonate tautomerase family)